MSPVKSLVNSSKELKNVYSLAAIAMLLALCVVLGILANTTLPTLAYVGKIKLMFLPISVAAAVFGPVPAMLVGGLGDVLSWVFAPMGKPFFPGFTVSAMLTGLIFGFAFYGRKVSLPRVIIAWFINAVAVEIFLFAFWFTFSGMAGDQSYWVIVVERLIMEGIKCVPEIMLIFGVGKLVERIPLKKFKIKKQ